MKEIKSEDLVIGEIYSDTPEIEDCTTFLEFVGFDEIVQCCDFVYVSGLPIYIEINGVISLSKYTKFYQP